MRQGEALPISQRLALQSCGALRVALKY